MITVIGASPYKLLTLEESTEVFRSTAPIYQAMPRHAHGIASVAHPLIPLEGPSLFYPITSVPHSVSGQKAQKSWSVFPRSQGCSASADGGVAHGCRRQ